MAKKKPQKQPRSKRLRLVSNAPVGLSDSQQAELSQMYRPLAHVDSSQLPDFSDIEAWRRIEFERLLCIYIEALCADARRENAKARGRRTVVLRRQILGSIEKLAGRDFSPSDLIKELSKHAPVPEYAKDAIRRDYLGISIR
jgi:hypothetical protein